MSRNYKDITKNWIEPNINRKNFNLKPLNYGDKFIYKGCTYIYDNKHIKYDNSKKELKFAEWLSHKKYNIYLNPSINKPEGISTADLTINNELYDMKIISGKSNQIIYHNIRGKENQANNFLFESSKSSLTLNELTNQVEEVFKRSDMKFVNKIGIKKDNNFIYIKENKKVIDTRRKVATTNNY